MLVSNRPLDYLALSLVSMLHYQPIQAFRWDLNPQWVCQCAVYSAHAQSVQYHRRTVCVSRTSCWSQLGHNYYIRLG
jgi:hypothetical protein